MCLTATHGCCPGQIQVRSFDMSLLIAFSTLLSISLHYIGQAPRCNTLPLSRPRASEASWDVFSLQYGHGGLTATELPVVQVLCKLSSMGCSCTSQCDQVCSTATHCCLPMYKASKTSVDDFDTIFLRSGVPLWQLIAVFAK